MGYVSHFPPPSLFLFIVNALITNVIFMQLTPVRHSYGAPYLHVRYLDVKDSNGSLIQRLRRKNEKPIKVRI